MPDLKRAIKRVLPLDVLQSSELKDVLERYATPLDEYGRDETQSHDDDDDASVTSSCFSSEDPQQPNVDLSPARMIDERESDLRPRVTSLCRGGNGGGGSVRQKRREDVTPDVVRATAAAALVAGGGGWWQSVQPYLTTKWIVIAVLALALIYAGWRYWRMWRTLGWQYALSAAFPFLRGAVCWLSGMDSAQVEAEIESFVAGIHPAQQPPAPAAAIPAAAPAAAAPPPAPEPAAPAPQKSVKFSRDEVIAEMVERALAAPPEEKKSAPPPAADKQE